LQYAFSKQRQLSSHPPKQLEGPDGKTSQRPWEATRLAAHIDRQFAIFDQIPADLEDLRLSVALALRVMIYQIYAFQVGLTDHRQMTNMLRTVDQAQNQVLSFEVLTRFQRAMRNLGLGKGADEDTTTPKKDHHKKDPPAGGAGAAAAKATAPAK
jgi:hypothetical protein